MVGPAFLLVVSVVVLSADVDSSGTAESVDEDAVSDTESDGMAGAAVEFESLPSIVVDESAVEVEGLSSAFAFSLTLVAVLELMLGVGSGKE